MEHYPDIPGVKEHGGASEEAANVVSASQATLQAEAITALARHPDGLTADEIAKIVNRSILAIRPRLSELYLDNVVYKTDNRRRNAVSGLYATVWKLTPGGKHVNDISPLSINVEKVIQAYVILRDQIAEEKRLYEERIEPRKKQLEQLNDILLKYLNATNQKAAPTNAGTAYKKVWHSATVADKEAFRRHVIGGELWDLLDWRANKTAVLKTVEENQEPPPGINFSMGYDVGVRRPGKED